MESTRSKLEPHKGGVSVGEGIWATSQEKDREIEELTQVKEVQLLALEELKAELALAQAKLRRAKKLELAAPTLVGLLPAQLPTGQPLHPVRETIPGRTRSSLSISTPKYLPSPVTRPVAGSSTPLTHWTVPMTTPLASPLPQILPFTGEGRQDGEAFQDWHEQFEAVANLGHWDDHCKLVNLTARL